MFLSALSFLIGICGFFYSPVATGSFHLWLPGLLLLLSRKPAMRLTGIACAGVLWAGWQGGQVLQAQLPAALEGRDIRVRGQVEGLPAATAPDRLRFLFHIEQVETPDGWQALPLRARLSWYRHKGTLRAGERWQLRLRLRRPRGFANPGGFDYERWLFAQRIGATGYVRGKRDNRLLERGAGTGLARLRQQLALRLEQVETAPPLRALLRGLGIGDRGGMSPEQWQVLRRTGTSHLLAISGLHIGMVAGLAFWVMRRLWSLGGLARYWPAPRAAALAAMLAATVYALLAGMQVPAQRALLMVCTWSLALLWNGRADPWRVWSLALFAVLLLDPLAVLSAGFWLSFAAVGLIFFLTTGRQGRAPRLQRLGVAQFGLLFGLTPLLWFWFGQVSFSAPLANLVAIPWVGLVVVPLLLSGLLLSAWLPLVSGWLLALAAQALGLLWWLLEALAALPLNLWQAPPLSATGLLLFGLGVLALLLPRALRLAPAALLLMLPVFYQPLQRPRDGDLWLALLDVGQGLAVVLETRRHLLVYDTGPVFRSGFNTGEAVIAPFLLQRGHRHVDRLVVSHSDNDHSGGGAGLFRQLPVYTVRAGEPERIAWARAGRCLAGQRWRWDGVAFEFLAPAGERHGNNASCVLRIETADGRVVLLPGDIEARVERQLLDTAPARLQADVLVVPHHGSNTSSTGDFIAAVRPRLALFATGYRNRFGLPAGPVLARYRAAGARLLDTADSGAILLRLEAGRPLRPDRYRERVARAWNRPRPDGGALDGND